jgi:glycosyltransferase involved in cell wall biosynthesis
MLEGRKVAVVMPAYNAAGTLERTLREINRETVDDIILVDDASVDGTVAEAKRLGLRTIIHPSNRGYGANQKTCYAAALESGADIVVMLHPDYQYTPKLMTAMASLIAVGEFDVVLGSRILSGGALKGGMPVYKYVANRLLTVTENLVTGAKLSEYHTGYRAFSRRVLTTLPLLENSDDFVFDAQMLAQCLYFGFRVAEVSCPTRYERDSSSINFRRSVVYGLGVLGVSALYRSSKWGLTRPAIFDPNGERLKVDAPPAPRPAAKRIRMDGAERQPTRTPA